MSSSSSSGVSAAAGFTPASQLTEMDLIPELKVPAPVQAAPSSEHLCYVHCHFCDTVLVVSVPSGSLFKTVTVRCGHCSSLLTVNMRGLLFPSTPSTNTASSSITTTTTSPEPAASDNNNGHQLHYPRSFNLAPSAHSLLDEISSVNPSLQLQEEHGLGGLVAGAAGCRNAAPPPPLAAAGKGTKEPSPLTNSEVNRPPEKRQRVPSAYNRFIKDEIQRIKAGNPDISHREAFSAAAKNWAHFPHIHFGLMPDHQGLRKTSLLPQDHQRKEGIYAAAAAANMGVGPY